MQIFILNIDIIKLCDLWITVEFVEILYEYKFDPWSVRSEDVGFIEIQMKKMAVTVSVLP